VIVRTYYSGGKFCSFDTDHMTEALPLNGNMLTNWALDLDDVNNGCLWLSCYYHEIAEAYREPIGPKGLPVARRRDGWSFLVADAEFIVSIDISRFADHGKLASYCGLAPRDSKSGTSLLSVTSSKRGNKKLKNLLIFSCNSLTNSKNRFGEYYRMLRDVRHMPHGKALKAVARKRLKVIYAIMRDKVPYAA